MSELFTPPQSFVFTRKKLEYKTTTDKSPKGERWSEKMHVYQDTSGKLYYFTSANIVFYMKQESQDGRK
jgi:hypothetical protein